MKVRVQYTGQLRTAVGRSEEEIELPDAVTLHGLLQHLADRHQEMSPHLLAGSGRLQPSLLVVIDEAAVPVAMASIKHLKPGDVITLMPPIAGG
jgi:sulfur-carrier protein